LKNIATPYICLCVALALTLSANKITAQNTSHKRTRIKATSSPLSKTRARRVAASKSNGSPPDSRRTTDISAEPGESDVKPIVEATGTKSEPVGAAATKSAEKSADKLIQTPAESPVAPADRTTSDSFQSLRDQINAAPSGPERIRLQLKLAEQFDAVEHKAEAIEELRAIADTDVFDPQDFFNAGNAFARMGASDDAIRVYRKAIDQRKGKYSRALNNLGVVLLRTGRWDEAYDSFMSALTLESFRYAEASYNLGRLYSARGERDLAIREWRRALAVDPQHTAAAKALAGTDATIVVRTNLATESKSGNAKSTHVSAPSSGNSVASTRIERSPARRPETSKVLYVDPVSYEVLQRARSLREHGKLEQSVGDYKNVIARSRGYLPPANLELSAVLLNLKRYDEALAYLLMVTSRDGARYPISYYYLGRFYALKGDLALAEEAFSSAANAYKSENSSILLDVSRVREQRKDFAGALAALEEYVAAMERQGQKPSWAEESLSVLRRKANAAQK
jgi:tetratricopeptide (TPR) repeat protein